MPPYTEPMVGHRIRAVREGRGLSLRALAQRSGLSMNAISLMERGENSPTVSSLHRLATALEVPITAFFQGLEETELVVVRRDQRSGTSSLGLLLESLGSGLRDQQLEPFLLTLSEGDGGENNPVSHPGQEFAFCLEGRVEYLIREERVELGPGDSLLLDSSAPHRFSNVGEGEAQLLLVFQGGREAQRHHLDT